MRAAFGIATARAKHPIAVSPDVVRAAHRDADDVLRDLGSAADTGLSTDEAARRLEALGPNEVAQERPPTLPLRLVRVTWNPLVILLIVLAVGSFASGDERAGAMMLAMIVLGVGLRLWQEGRADAAAARLKAMIRVTATVVRDGRAVELPLRHLVPGDVVHLCAGDMIPGDVRLLAAKDLFVTQATLTGESMPVEKFAHACSGGDSPIDLPNLCFMGTSVQSGSAAAVVVATGPRTYLGAMAASLAAGAPQTSFDRGINRFTWLMITLMAVMVPLVFLINGLTKHQWRDAFFFALAVAVGLTPEMLPMIVSVCLSKGAMAMSRRKVIVKHLNSIQNLGAMDVLCTDKTGTLTLDRVILHRHCNVAREDQTDVLLEAYLISHFQTGLKNILDAAILESPDFHAHDLVGRYAKLDEVPFDFERRMMSVLVRDPDGRAVLLAKGAPEALFPRCADFDLDGERSPMTPMLVDELRLEHDELGRDGFRVLAIATKGLDGRTACSKDDEHDLTLVGYVAFLDPPKDSARPALAALCKHGVAVKVLTGDAPLITRKVCADVGLAAIDPIITGPDLQNLSDAQLGDAAERATVMCRLSPADKHRIIRALQSRGHVVGFLGDGINDAPALRIADVGVSVDTAVDVAKAAADLILLEKSLTVVDDAVLEGRAVFANILKYVRMGASSNFGNMFSVLGASCFLPFVPMLPIQVLTNNLLYDVSQVPIPTDDVDPEQVARPQPWDVGRIRRFVLLIGPVSSVFDFATFAVLLWLFGCWAPDRWPLFRTGWFVESVLTQTLVIHVIRTRRLPFIQSRASWPLGVMTALIATFAIWLPYSPLATALGFVPPPPSFWPVLLLTVAAYLAVTQLVKTLLLRRGWV